MARPEHLRCGDVVTWVADRLVIDEDAGTWVDRGDLGTYITGTPPDGLVVTFEGGTFTCPADAVEPLGRP